MGIFPPADLLVCQLLTVFVLFFFAFHVLGAFGLSGRREATAPQRDSMGVAYFKRFVCILSIPYILQKNNPPKQWITLLKKLIAGREIMTLP